MVYVKVEVEEEELTIFTREFNPKKHFWDK